MIEDLLVSTATFSLKICSKIWIVLNQPENELKKNLKKRTLLHFKPL